jgi:hypothetical protein
MNWIFESPLTIVLLGAAALALLSTVWVQTGKSQVLIAMGVVGALLIAGLVVERMVQTDREKLEATVRDIAADVRRNDHAQLYQHIAKSAPELRARAQAEIPNYQFTECTVTKFYRVEVKSDKRPKEAEVEFMVSVSGNFNYQGFQTGDGTYLRFVRLYFVEEPNGEWKVRDYAHDDPSAAMVNKPLGK